MPPSYILQVFLSYYCFLKEINILFTFSYSFSPGCFLQVLFWTSCVLLNIHCPLDRACAFTFSFAIFDWGLYHVSGFQSVFSPSVLVGFSNNLSHVLYPTMQSTPPCSVHPLLSAGCPEPFPGACLSALAHPAQCVPHLGHNPCVTFLFTHLSAAFTLIASPVDFFCLCLLSFCVFGYPCKHMMHLTYVLSSLADHSLFVLLQSPIHQSHFSCYSAQCKVTPKTPESGIRYNQLSRSCWLQASTLSWLTRKIQDPAPGDLGNNEDLRVHQIKSLHSFLIWSLK